MVFCHVLNLDFIVDLIDPMKIMNDLNFFMMDGNHALKNLLLYFLNFFNKVAQNSVMFKKIINLMFDLMIVQDKQFMNKLVDGYEYFMASCIEI